MNRRISLSIATLLLLGLSCLHFACSPTAACTAITDCTPGELCVLGKCQAAPSCTTDTDCPTKSMFCKDSTCVDKQSVECTKSDECKIGFACMDNKCIEQPKSPARVLGTSSCDSAQHFAKGAEGTRLFRTVIVTDDNVVRAEALSPDKLSKAPYNLTSQSFRVIDGSPGPVVLDESGEVVKDVSVALSVDATHQLGFLSNPNYVALSSSQEHPRLALFHLTDMSDNAAERDPTSSRTSVPAGWVLEHFNESPATDILGGLLMRSGMISASDSLFKGLSSEKQYIADDGRTRGLVFTSQETKELVSQMYTNISNAKADGLLPLYAAIEAMALDMRAAVWSKGKLLFNPGIIAVSLGLDMHKIDPKIDDKASAAAVALLGDGKSTVPLMSIVYPKPEKVLRADWDKHIEQQCRLAMAITKNTNSPGGLVFVVPSSPRRNYQKDVRSAHDAALHALKGFTELKLKYKLSGNVQKGKRYTIRFQLQATIQQQKSPSEDAPNLYFEVEP